MRSDSFSNEDNASDFLSGGGELGKRIREFDWSNTSLGPVNTWPHSLRTCIRIMLTSRQPIWIGWGKDLIKLYNDPYIAIAGGKHPLALGTPASVVWKDIWREIGPMLRQVMEKDEGTYVESQLLIMERNGYPEETYYTFSYTPIPGDDGKTAGVFCANTDDTVKIISERQLKTLTQLGKRLTNCQNNTEVIKNTIDTLRENPHDFPFAIFGTISGSKAILAYSTPLGVAENVIPKELELEADNILAASIKKALATREPQIIEDAPANMGAMPTGAWEKPPEKAIALPIVQTGIKEPYGVLVVGLNPYRLLDDKYSSFFSLISDQIATSFADVHLLEEERKRAEALAEIDRAKTIFFSNISHEFRTPLTLLLGPVEDMLLDSRISPDNKERLDLAYRNALRMQKLVNTLLEFSRIEAGRVEGRFSRIDISSFTKDLASIFRSAIEKAGMQLYFSSDEIKNEVYVDKEMWEKIILNLVSNAFKYSKEGKIEVKVAEVDNRIEVTVFDTGLGIPEDQLSKIFERFHRIENIHGRSQEGTGIGLAMVKELVKIHRGTISVKSKLWEGSAFTVAIPAGRDHLPADKIVDLSSKAIVSKQADVFIEEAMKWLPGVDAEVTEEVVYNPGIEKGHTEQEARYTVLLADDNTDMRKYLQKVLSPHFNIIESIDGNDAFNKLMVYKPDLVLSDIMMPELDGFGLLQKIRNHPDSKHLPVIFLSARAGEEAKVEGLEAGADDYLVKPFSARELLARVESNIKIAKGRIAAEANLRNMIMQSPIATVLLRGPSFIVEIVNGKGLQIWNKSYEEAINRPLAEVLPELIEQGFINTLQQVFRTGESFNGYAVPVEFVQDGITRRVYLDFLYSPLRNDNDEIIGIIGAGIDVSAQVEARQQMEENEKLFRTAANATPAMIWMASAEKQCTFVNNAWLDFTGRKLEQELGSGWLENIHPDDYEESLALIQSAYDKQERFNLEFRIKNALGEYRWIQNTGIPRYSPAGVWEGYIGSCMDIHEIVEHDQQKDDFIRIASHELKTPITSLKAYIQLLLRMPVTDSDSFLKHSLLTAEKQVSRLTRLINDLLDPTKIESGNFVINKQMFNIGSLITEVVEEIQAVSPGHRIILEKNVENVVFADRQKISQVFINLLGNAIKYSPKSDKVIVTLQSSNGAIIVAVQDFGVGIAPSDQGRIFEKFYRVKNQYSEHYPGFGIGLFIAHYIIKQHDGHIWLTSEKGKGSTFYFSLPYSSALN